MFVGNRLAHDREESQSLRNTALTVITQTRRTAAAAGVLLLVTLGIVSDSPVGDRVANVALASLMVASLLACAEVLALRHKVAVTPTDLSRTDRATWTTTYMLVGVVSILMVQTWFRSNSSVAGGDIGPPDGLAWIDRLFSPWVWSGSDLGSPGTLALQLPWAGFLTIVHAIGGSPVLAQRLWISGLFSLSAIAALLLLQTVGARPIPAVVGAGVYVLNPYVIVSVGTSPIFLMMLAMAALLPACILAASRSRIRVRTGAILLGLSGPLFGYVYQNPPSAGMLLAVVLATPLLAWWLWGTQAAIRAVTVALAGGALLAALSAYWIVPAAIHLQTTAISSLAGTSGWAWTEGRATIANAFWLNTSWAWAYREYFPYAPAYSIPPLSFIKFLLPAAAFAALWLPGRRHVGRDRDSADPGLPLVAAASLIALLLVFVSTGTRPPGNAIFNLLYQLPYGWLLREPGRFLMLAGLAYSLLVAAVIAKLSRPRPFALHFSSRTFRLQPLVAIVLASLVLVGPGFPIVFGAVAPDARLPLPSSHVRLPTYWPEMASFIDRAPYEGAVVALPPDDFYQMPYQWGYYGTDSFIPVLMHRHVLVPNDQGGYFQDTGGLPSAVRTLSSSLLDGNWEEAGRLVESLTAPLILVRGDIRSDFPGRSVISPNSLGSALKQAPNFLLIHQSGPLELFAYRGSIPSNLEIGASYVTVDSSALDLRFLSLFPHGTHLVSGSQLPRDTRLTPLSALSDWPLTDGKLELRVPEAVASRYEIGILTGVHADLLDPREPSPTLKPFTATEQASGPGAGRVLIVQVQLGANQIANGTFSLGPWQRTVGNCNNQDSPSSQLAATVMHDGPNGQPTLRLSASADSACEAQPVGWSGGSLLVSFKARNLSGAPPRVCLLEVGLDRCAPSRSSAQGTDWLDYSVYATPEAGTKGLILYIYSDGNPNTIQTVNEYTGFSVHDVPASELVLVDYPSSGTGDQLLVLHESYSPDWIGPRHSVHVLVDGMTNGWLVPSVFLPAAVTYGPTRAVEIANWFSAVTAAVLLIGVVSLIPFVYTRTSRLYSAVRGVGRSHASSGHQAPGDLGIPRH